MEILFKGILLGFAIAAPVGPIGLLCIRRTLQYGRLSGLYSGLGAATADLFYAMIAALGLTLVSDFFLHYLGCLKIIGGAVLLYLGIKTFFSHQVDDKDAQETKSHTPFKDFFSTFLLTLTNPLTILAFFAMFASFGLASIAQNRPHISLLLIGIFLGSSLWWLLLSEGVSFFRKKMGNRLLTLLNRIAGIALISFGILSWVSLFFCY